MNTSVYPVLEMEIVVLTFNQDEVKGESDTEEVTKAKGALHQAKTLKA